MKPLVLVTAGAALISFAPILVKLAHHAGVGASAIGAWRTLMGSAILFALLRARRAPLIPERRVLAVAALAGVAFAADLFVWHRSIAFVGAGMATILGNTQVFWVSAYGLVVYREPFSLRFVAAVLCAFAGIVLLAGAGSDVALTRPYLDGIALGLATGLAYACYLLILQRGNSGGSPTPAPTGAKVHDPLAGAMSVLAWVTLVSGCLLTFATVLEGAPLALPNLRALVILLGLAVVAQVVGWLVIASGLRHAPASRAGLALLTQPALATVWGVAFFGEALAPLQIVGAVLTLGAIAIGSRPAS